MSNNDWLRNRIELTHKVRSVLVRYYIDLGYLDISVTPRGVTLRGVLKATRGASIKLTPEVVNEIFKSIMFLRNVKRVYGEFANWKQAGGRAGWQPVKIDESEEAAAKPVPQAKTGAANIQSKVFEVVALGKKSDSEKEPETELRRL